MEDKSTHKIPSEIILFAAANFPALLSNKILDHWQAHGRLPKKIWSGKSIFYPRQMYACMMYRRAAELVAG